MRNQNEMIDCFMPKHEKEWESRLFIDKAIKDSTEYHLEAIARALTGKYKIRLSCAEKDNPFIKTEHIQGDDEKWIVKTKKYLWEAKFDSYIIYGRNRIDIWLKIISFWAAKESIFPCGAASFPNEKAEFKIKEEV